MTPEAEAAFKVWIIARNFAPAPMEEAYSAGHAAADTDAARKLARMVELEGVLKAEGERYAKSNYEIEEALGEAYTEVASLIRAIVEDNQSNSAVTPAAAEYSTPQAPAHSEIEPDGRPEEER